MNHSLAHAVFDELLPGWRQAKRVGKNRELRAPYREDHHPSLHVHEDEGVWIDRATGEGGGAWDLAKKMRGEDGAKDLLKRLDPNDTESPATQHTTAKSANGKGSTVECCMGSAPRSKSSATRLRRRSWL